MREAPSWGTAGVEQKDRAEKGELDWVPGQRSERRRGVGWGEGVGQEGREKDIGLSGKTGRQ